jgi:hypothetical protein
MVNATLVYRVPQRSQLDTSQVNEFLQSHTVLGQFLLADVGDSEEQAAVAFVGV